MSELREVRRAVALLAGASVLAAFVTAFGAGMQSPPPNFVTGYVWLDGVPGASRSKPGWIEVSSLTVACDATRRAFFTHRVDQTQTSSALREAMSRGTRIPKGAVDLRITRYALTDVRITGIEPVAGDSVGRETVTLSFAACAPS